MIFLETERLVLRSLMPEDAETMIEYRNDPDCARYQRWEENSREDILRLIRDFSWCVFLSEVKSQKYAVALKSGEMVGDLSYFFSPGDCVTLGYTVAPRYQRRGFAFEILTAVLEKIREKYPEIDVVCLVDKDNLPSVNLLKKLGFEEECYSEKIKSCIYVKKDK